MQVREGRVEISTEEVMNRVIPCLISRENFSHLPEDTPHVNYDEMVIIFRVVFEPGEGPHPEYGRAAGIISRKVMEEMETNLGTLLAKSMSNAEGTFKVAGLTETIIGLFDEITGEGLDPITLDGALDPGAETVFVLTNKSGMFGAAGMLFEEALKMAASKVGGDFYLIPSSIHECLIIPAREGEDWMELKNILTRINNEIVAPEDILSYSLYRYNSRTKALVKED